MGLSDAAAWYITLANAVLFRGLAPGTTSGFPEHSSNVEAMKWYTLSLRSIKSRLVDPVMSVSEGLVIAVTGFLCHDVCACFFCSLGAYINTENQQIVYSRQLRPPENPHGRPRTNPREKRRLGNPEQSVPTIDDILVG